jgi:signal transduction histidine kinase
MDLGDAGCLVDGTEIAAPDQWDHVLVAFSPAQVGGARAVVTATGVLMALGTGALAWDPRAVPMLVLDLAAGMAYVGLAAVALPYARPVTWLASLVAVTWFAGTAWAGALFWHRGALVWLLLAFPLMWPTTRMERATVVGAVVVSATPVMWSAPIPSLAAAAAVAAVGAWSASGSSPRGRAVRTARLALVAFAAITFVGSVLELVRPSGATLLVYVVYEVVVGGIAVALAVALPRPSPSAVADIVIDLEGTEASSVRERLSRVLGDRGIRLSFWDAAAGAYRDHDGAQTGPPEAGSDRTITELARGGNPFAMIEHDTKLPTTPVLVEAIAGATAVVDAHDRLTADIRARIIEVTDARRRLVRAADQERLELRSRLSRTVERPLSGLLDSLEDEATIGGAALPELQRARGMLQQALAELAAAAQGIRPAELDGGLAHALRILASRSALQVELWPGPLTRYPPEVEAAMHAACSEALQNCAKHAHVDRVALEVVESDGLLLIRIRDQGAGGADPSRGGGLRGLQDRVRSVGGSVRVDSPAGAGTTIELSYAERA